MAPVSSLKERLGFADETFNGILFAATLLLAILIIAVGYTATTYIKTKHENQMAKMGYIQKNIEIGGLIRTQWVKEEPDPGQVALMKRVKEVREGATDGE